MPDRGLRRDRSAVHPERALHLLVSEVPEVMQARSSSGAGLREASCRRAGGETKMRLKCVCWILITCCTVYFSQAALASQQTPEELAQLWLEAIKTSSTAKIRPLIHPACPQNSISPEILARMVQGGLPETYEIETKELGPRAELEKIYQVVPEKQLNIKYRTNSPEDRARYGLGKGFPIAKASGEWFFVICAKSG
jgi:hypothetical protein